MTLRGIGRAARLPAALSLVLLAGCASLPPPTPGEHYSGRLAISVEGRPDRSVSAGFELTGTASRGELALSGPLGTTAAQARWSPGQAVLSTGGSSGDLAFDNLDALALRALGEPIPIAALFDWLRGQAWPGAPASPRPDGAAGFEQLGWQVGLARLAEGWIDARRPAPPAITVRIRLQRPD